MGLSEVAKYNLRQQQLYAAKTGLIVDIQNIGRNRKTLVLPVKKSIEQIYSGVWMSSESMELEGGCFTNIYDLYWNSEDSTLSAVVHSEKKPYYLLDYMESKDSILAVMNGSFFYLVDEDYREPKEYPYNFCIRDGKVMGLPSSNLPILFTVDQKLYAKETEAKGTIDIAGKIIFWRGSENENNKIKTYAVLYNSASAKIIKTFDPKTGVRQGIINKNHVHTPLRAGALDIVINEDKNGILRISALKSGGGTHFFEGLFVLQLPKFNDKFKIGQEVKPLTLDKINIQGVSSGITINKNVKNSYFFKPHRIKSRDARSVIAKDRKGNMHFIVFDGSKYIPGFNGVSANDLKDYFSNAKFEWAYFIDGGSSSRIIVRDKGKLRFFANEVTFKKIASDLFLWDWKRHRKLSSSLTLRINPHQNH